MEKTVLFGLGNDANKLWNMPAYFLNAKPIAFVDDSEQLCGTTLHNIPVISPEQFRSEGYARMCPHIFIGAGMLDFERYQKIVDFLVNVNRLYTFQKAAEELAKRVQAKYSESADEEIRNMLADWANNGRVPNIFGNYRPSTRRDIVLRDSDNFPYVMLEDKKLFLTKDYNGIFKDNDGTEYISDVLWEQRENSPHLYIRDETDISEGAIIVDAGVCEGNFALRYVERAKKIYLIEPEPKWREPLYRTFEPYKEKIVFCDKFLGRYNSTEMTTLDTLLNGEHIDFLKMDIEGAEIDALLGAKRVLLNSNARVAVCCYHHQNDEENIKMLLQVYGYATDNSKGYMFFLHDKDIADTLDFRRGIVYGRQMSL